jgi:hypothetical protein
MGKKRNVYQLWYKNIKERDPLEDPRVGGRILKCILRNRMGTCGLDSSGSGYGALAGSCVYGNESQESIKMLGIS